MRRGAWYLGLAVVWTLAGCSTEKPAGSVQVEVIHPSGPGCQYSISPVPIDTLSSINGLYGLVGHVVVNPQNLGSSPSILDNGTGFDPISVSWIRGGGLYAPQDLTTLFGASLYYAIEKGYEMFAGLSPASNLAQVVPNFSDTLIVNEARRTFGTVGATPEVSDNAEYLPHDVTVNGQTITKNYFLSYPSQDVSQVPLGLNLGIMVHEFTHMVFHYLFWAEAFAQNEQAANDRPTANTLSALDEGLADYFGYLVTQDPHFFECSFPQENRDLSVPKAFTDQVVADIQGGGSGFDPHEGGAIFAAINYEIGMTLGNPQLNGQYLVNFMANLLNCPAANEGSNTLSIDFGVIAQCQLAAADPSAQSVISSVYAKYLGAYASGAAGAAGAAGGAP